MKTMVIDGYDDGDDDDDWRTCLWANPCWPIVVSPRIVRPPSWSRRRTHKDRPPQPCGPVHGSTHSAATITTRFLRFFFHFLPAINRLGLALLLRPAGTTVLPAAMIAIERILYYYPDGHKTVFTFFRIRIYTCMCTYIYIIRNCNNNNVRTNRYGRQGEYYGDRMRSQRRRLVEKSTG